MNDNTTSETGQDTNYIVTPVKYASFTRRMLAVTIDTLFIAATVSPLMLFVDKILSLKMFNIQEQFAGLGYEKILELPYQQQEELIDKMLQSFIYQSVVVSLVLMAFWFWFSATPGKMILRMKIVDAKTFGKPTQKQLIIRFFGYIISTLVLCLGFVWISFDKRRQGLHDKMSGTVVIIKDYGTEGKSFNWFGKLKELLAKIFKIKK